MTFVKATTLVSLLKDCAQQKDLIKGSRLHSSIIRWGLLGKNRFVGNTLAHMYVKCGAFARAHDVFHELRVRDVVLWTLLIAGFAQHGRGADALNCFRRMQCEGVSPNAVTLACILKACGSVGASKKGREIHASVVGTGLLSKDTVLGNALTHMYGKCGAITQAQHVFNELPVRNLVSWNAMMTGYCLQGNGEEALICFKQLKDEGVSPDGVTFLCGVKACGSIGAVEKGSEIHVEIVRQGLLDTDYALGNALVDMYSKCGALLKAKQVFEELPSRDIVSWTVLIAGYSDHGYTQEALDCFEKLRLEGLSPNEVTFLSVVKACGSLPDAGIGLGIHEEIARTGQLGRGKVLGSALVDMYAKCGALAKAREVFDELPVRDIVSWTSLITEYCQQEHSEKALQCFERMKGEGLYPDAAAFACMLKACGSVGATEKGEEIYAEIVREGLLGKATVVASALVDMYAKSNALERAQEVFDELPIRDVASWTALMSGYAHAGQHRTVIYAFNSMLVEGIEPNAVTFTVVLSACGASGLTNEGQRYFEVMSGGYGIVPASEHHTCMVDLFSREGRLDKALAVLTKIPFAECLPAWFALLGACKRWENAKLAWIAFENALRLDGKSAAAYISMGHIYAASEGKSKDCRVRRQEVAQLERV